jgi:tRNA(adenine34) deaminase
LLLYPCPMSHSDELWMEEALREAQRALALGEVPVGAVVICDGRVVGRGCNRPLTANDPTAHAEILALREAGKTVGNYRLLDCDLYVTVEPCAMCSGAITHARIRQLIYGAEDPKAGAVHSMLQVLNHPKLNHKVEVSSGVLAARSMDLVQAFFRKKRNSPDAALEQSVSGEATESS